MKSNEATKSESSNRMLRWFDVSDRTKLSRSKVNELEALGKFPKRISLGHRLVVWKSCEIEKWIDNPLGYAAGSN